MSNNKLTVKERKNMFRRWIFSAGLGYNYESQQAPSVAFSMRKALRKIYSNDDEYIDAMDNHYKYFNVTPQMGNVILGATLAMEEKDGIEAKDDVQSLKTSLMGPLSGVGDSVFWILIPTIMGSIAGYMALQKNAVGSLVPAVVKVYTPLKFATGKVSLSLQKGIFDKIMPGLLPVCLALLVYWLLGKKSWTPTRIILLIILICLIGAATGILGIAA